jgi:hypothetical protein
LDDQATIRNDSSSGCRDLSTDTSVPPDTLVVQIQRLSDLLKHYHQRLHQSNTLTLNRRLRRAFDIDDLSQLSNAVIDNTLRDVQLMQERFANYPDLMPLLDIVGQLVTEYGRLKKTMNEVGSAYVAKVNEMSRREADEMMSEGKLPRSGASLPDLRRQGRQGHLRRESETSFIQRAGAWLWRPGSRSDSQESLSVRSGGSRPGTAQSIQLSGIPIASGDHTRQQSGGSSEAAESGRSNDPCLIA